METRKVVNSTNCYVTCNCQMSSTSMVVNSEYEDDEEILAIKDTSGGKPASFLVGTAEATIINKTEAPLEETKFNVLLELTGSGLSEDRPGLDLVAVLDVSGSMGEDQRLPKLQRAMRFLIRKLSPIDRLSIVCFNHKAERRCRLRQVTEDSQQQIEDIVNGLKAKGGTNIPAGVSEALDVINARRCTTGRTTAIMVMSDGVTFGKTDEEKDYYISKLHMKEVPVFTFGFGNGQDSRVLNKIAKGSKGGTYSDVQNTSTLSLAFSQCLAGLLTVVVEDLTLTVAPLTVPPLNPTMIEKVNAGYYPMFTDLNAGGSVTVSFGDLYDKEVRKVLVELLLPKANSRIGMDFLRVAVSYKSQGKKLDAPPILATVTRTNKSEEKERDEVIVEMKRLRAARAMRRARESAEAKKLREGQEELSNMQEELENVVLNKPSALIDMLISELKQLFDYMVDQPTYERLGRPFALSAETSHALQRFAARGDIEKLRMFATERMNAYLDQAKLFDKDPLMKLSSSIEDLKKDINNTSNTVKPNADAVDVALKLIATAVIAAVISAVIAAVFAAAL